MTPPIGGTYIPEQGKAVGFLTDGTGVSAFNSKKFVKDFVADFLMSAAAAIMAVQIVDVGSAVAAPQVVAFAILGALIRSVYRASLRWATTE
jgi:hypothetical protein